MLILSASGVHGIIVVSNGFRWDISPRSPVNNKPFPQ